MTTAIGDSNPTMLDVAKRLDGSGRIMNIVEQLSKRTPELEDATVMEGNLITGHRVSLRTALPSPTWRMANQGIPGSKSLADTLDESCGQLAGRSVVDPDVANLGGNAAAYRAKEDSAFLSAMSYEVATGIWYHSHTTAPQKFHGLSPRLALTTGTYGGQIVDSQITASGDDQASAWWVCWGDSGAYLIYPKGSKAGLEQKDMGEQMVADANGDRFPAFETVWKWHVGLCVEDYRQVCRVANIDTSAVAETGTLMLQDLLKGYHQIGNPQMGRCTLYVNRRLAFFMHSQAVFGTSSSTLKYETDLGSGRKILTFMGCPVRTTDSLLNTEAIVS
jgi:hypothetical protein